MSDQGDIPRLIAIEAPDLATCLRMIRWGLNEVTHGNDYTRAAALTLEKLASNKKALKCLTAKKRGRPYAGKPLYIAIDCLIEQQLGRDKAEARKKIAERWKVEIGTVADAMTSNGEHAQLILETFLRDLTPDVVTRALEKASEDLRQPGGVRVSFAEYLRTKSRNEALIRFAIRHQLRSFGLIQPN